MGELDTIEIRGDESSWREKHLWRPKHETSVFLNAEGSATWEAMRQMEQLVRDQLELLKLTDLWLYPSI